MDKLRSFSINPSNPKNVQIPFLVFIAMDALLGRVDVAQLSAEENVIYKYVCDAIAKKKGSITNRQAFAAIAHAQEESEKQAALDNYLNTKRLNK